MRKERSFNQMREISFEKNVNIHADGSCLVKFGNTHVLCLATIDEKVPHWLKNTGKGWITAEYGMLPRSTNTRMDREAAKGKQSGRTQEIQRLIGRSLRSVIDLSNLGERQIKVDCDVLQADGGTRTASINGGFVALYIAIDKIERIEDEDNCKPPIFIIVSDPAGDPVFKYDSTNFLNINLDLSLICAYKLSDIRILFKNNIYLLLLNLYEKR